MKRIMKTVVCMTMAMLLALSFVSCGGKDQIVIGITQIVDHPSLDVCRQGAIDQLKAEGFVEGENLTVVYQSAQGDPAVASTIAQQYVADKVNVILAISTPSAQAAYATAMDKGIPVVFSAVTDPVAAEIAAADGSPLEGITGTSDEMPMEETFKMIQAMLPDAKKIGILHNTSEVNSDVQLAQAQALSAEFGMEIIDAGITSTNEIATALDTLLQEVDCMMNLTDNMVVSSMPLLKDKCLEANIPLFGSEDEQVKNGALASAGIDYYQLGIQTGTMIASILKGEAAANISIETLKEAKVTINTDIAEALGIQIPEAYSGAIFVTEGE